MESNFNITNTNNIYIINTYSGSCGRYVLYSDGSVERGDRVLVEKDGIYKYVTKYVSIDRDDVPSECLKVWGSNFFEF